VADPTLAVIRYAHLSRVTIQMWGAGTALGVIAMATHPVPAHVPISAVYLVVNAGFAISHTGRDVGRIRQAADFARDTPVRVVEPRPVWSAAWPMATVIVASSYFAGPAGAGRFAVACCLPSLAQALMTRRAIVRRERKGVELFVGGDEVYVHPRSQPLP
jgi:hypothetical protein